MKIEKRYKLELVTADKKDNRGVLNSIYCYKNGINWAVATNGKVLAKVPCQLEDNELNNGNSIKMDDFKYQKTNPAIKKQKHVFCSLEPIVSEFPNIDSVIPTEHTFRIALNVDLLKKLSQAIGSEIVILELQEGEKAMKVLPYNNENKAIGVLMPVRI